jgi:regulator of nucleoside diphosphate kinase
MTLERKAITASGEIKPRIAITAKDYEDLSLLARAAESQTPDLASVLLDELERAEILAEGATERAVGMGSEVEFRDDTTRKVQTVVLVYPNEADISLGRISILTPIGTALIGLGAGDSITWETRTGEVRQLTVLKVRASACLRR